MHCAVSMYNVFRTNSKERLNWIYSANMYADVGWSDSPLSAYSFHFQKITVTLKWKKNQKFANIFILLHRTIAKRKFEIKNYLKFCLNFLPPKWAKGKTSCFEFPFMVNKKKETWRRLKNCLQTLFC